jgi:hypothetical protein
MLLTLAVVGLGLRKIARPAGELALVRTTNRFGAAPMISFRRRKKVSR